jgi:hypothetical protein
MELMMNKLPLALVLGSMLGATPAGADHIFTPTPFPTLGACESENARLSNEDAERQFSLRPDLFSSMGEARSFMTRAFTCELDADDGYWYLTDHRREVIDSEWFERRRD